MESEFDDKTVTGDGNNKGNLSEEVDKSLSEHASFLSLNDASDEFFDDSESSDYDQSVAGWSPESLSKTWLQDVDAPSLSTDAGVVKKLLDCEETMHVPVQKQGYVDLQEMAREESILCCYGTLPKDPTGTLPCTWTTADPATFLIRGKSYIEDHQKKYAAQGGQFFFIVSIQVPGSTSYSLVLYYMMNTCLEDSPLLESFVKEDDAFRNSRFKLIPHLAEGPWILKKLVGTNALLVGQGLKMNYFHGKNYLEVGIDIGACTSTLAKNALNHVLPRLKKLVIEVAFLVQANTAKERPEHLLGTCRLNHLDTEKSVSIHV